MSFGEDEAFTMFGYMREEEEKEERRKKEKHSRESKDRPQRYVPTKRERKRLEEDLKHVQKQVKKILELMFEIERTWLKEETLSEKLYGDLRSKFVDEWYKEAQHELMLLQLKEATKPEKQQVLISPIPNLPEWYMEAIKQLEEEATPKRKEYLGKLREKSARHLQKIGLEDHDEV